ncbi:MAG: VOC family protein [Chloroflexota bacterium]
MKIKFDCVFYYVRNLDAAIRFYEDTLGMQLISRDAVARFDVDGVLFELVPLGEGESVSGSGNARLCLEVQNIEQTVQELKERGVPVGAVHTVSNGALATFEDADGNELVLWQYA